MPPYAARTKVAPDRTRQEIERDLRRYGATGFQYGWSGHYEALGFEMHGKRVRFLMVMPSPDDRAFTHGPSGRVRRSDDGAATAYQQDIRQRWRAMKVIILAKLEAVRIGIRTFEQEFATDMVVPGTDQTLGEWLLPQLEQLYQEHALPPLLPGMPDTPGGGARRTLPPGGARVREE